MDTVIQPIDPTLSINDILRRHPETIRLLTERGIDTCCEGGLPLSVAAADASLDLNTLLGELAGVIASSPVASRIEAPR